MAVFHKCAIIVSGTAGEYDLLLNASYIINPRRACAARVTVLGLCVCVSVTQHLTFHVFIRATNDTNLLGGR